MTCNVRYSLMVPSLIVVAEAFSQGIGCKKSFKHGSLPQVLPSIITQRATHTMTELQRGSSKAANSVSGRITDRYYGYVAFVCLSLPRRPFVAVDIFLGFSAGSGKSILWYVIPGRFQQWVTDSFLKFGDHRGHQTYARIEISSGRVLLL